MENNQPINEKLTKLFWIIYVSPILILTILFVLISKGVLGYMPDFVELENPKIDQASQIITEDKQLLGKYYLPENNRINVDYDDLSPHLINALIATEDIRFHRHSGVDLRGLARLIVFMGRKGGASTLSQQLAKQLFHVRSKKLLPTIWQKLNEWVIAVKLEKSYTKEEILAMYLNIVPFGSNSFGIRSAAHTFFNTTPDLLTVEQSAVLVGILKANTYYNPVENPDNSLRRRKVVLFQMRKYGYLSDTQYDSISSLPLILDYQKVDHNLGYGVYFREYLKRLLTEEKPERSGYNSYSDYKKDSATWEGDKILGWCHKNLKPDGSPYDLYGDGLRIYTTVNYNMQKYAEEAVEKHLSKNLQPAFEKELETRSSIAPFSKDLEQEQIDDILTTAMQRSYRFRVLRDAGLSRRQILKTFEVPVKMKVFTWQGDKDTIMTPLDSIRYYKKFLQTGFMSANPHNGHVKAYVGGINPRYFHYDHVKTGARQPGSLFKPFLYVLAWQNGYSPCKKVALTPQSFQLSDGTIWSPVTTNRDYVGTEQTLKWGIAHSDNLISAWLLKQFNPQPIVDIAHKIGIESYIDPVPSMILGTSDMTVYEMVSAFGTFANKGIHVKPMFVTRIEDKNGNLLGTFKPETRESISEKTAYVMLNALQNVVDKGSGHWLRSRYNFTSQIAGKTGTTQKNSDGWFMGIVPDLVTGIWVGAEERSVRFENGYLGQGASMALPIWALYMQQVYKDENLNYSVDSEFEVPENLNMILDCDEGSNSGIDPFY